MFVYVWKHEGVPFYVGLTNAHRRTNPLNAGGRGWLCKQKLEAVGRGNVVSEVYAVATSEEGRRMERELIAKFGRISLGTGTLTNLRPGGDGTETMSVDGRKATSKRMRENNPTLNPEVRAKIKARRLAPDIAMKFIGNNNPAKRPEVRAKLKAKWQDPKYQETQHQARIGIKRHSDEHKAKLRDKLLDPTNPMREYHKVLNSDPTIKAKRVASLQSPEIRAKISARLKEAWAKRKAIT